MEGLPRTPGDCGPAGQDSSTGGSRLFRDSGARLRTIRIAHTVVWAFLAGCIFGIPIASWRGHHTIAAALIGIVAVEVLVLVANRWRCPLTAIAARCTDRRDANFDIYLPEWLARHNQRIFGTLFALALVYAAARFFRLL